MKSIIIRILSEDRCPTCLVPLTKRESEILGLILRGRKNDEIIEQLCISKSTLKKHLQNIYKKTGVFNRIQLLTLSDTDRR
ncbi:MAG: helix-turn-helix transcriptional regulator [Firmicutes bacterium]|nr:helix-turn-helix transcriptional regulator [Bacillota bacterium]